MAGCFGCGKSGRCLPCDTVVDNGDDTITITQTDGSSVTFAAGTPDTFGDVVSNGDGTATITFPGGATATVCEAPCDASAGCVPVPDSAFADICNPTQAEIEAWIAANGPFPAGTHFVNETTLGHSILSNDGTVCCAHPPEVEKVCGWGAPIRENALTLERIGAGPAPYLYRQTFPSGAVVEYEMDQSAFNPGLSGANSVINQIPNVVGTIDTTTIRIVVGPQDLCVSPVTGCKEFMMARLTRGDLDRDGVCFNGVFSSTGTHFNNPALIDIDFAEPLMALGYTSDQGLTNLGPAVPGQQQCAVPPDDNLQMSGHWVAEAGASLTVQVEVVSDIGAGSDTLGATAAFSRFPVYDVCRSLKDGTILGVTDCDGNPATAADVIITADDFF